MNIQYTFGILRKAAKINKMFHLTQKADHFIDGKILRTKPKEYYEPYDDHYNAGAKAIGMFFLGLLWIILSIGGTIGFWYFVFKIIM